MHYKEIIQRDYSTPEVAKILGVSMRKIISMLERGYFKPSRQSADGYASKRKYDFWDIARAYVILDLLSIGISVDLARWLGFILAGDGIHENYLMIDKKRNMAVTQKNITEALGIDEKQSMLDFIQYAGQIPSPVIFIPLKMYSNNLLERIEQIF